MLQSPGRNARGFDIANFLYVLCLKHMDPKDVELKTKDGILIRGSLYENEDKSKGVILLHQFRRDRTSWNDFVFRLLTGGYNVLAVDFRGHGKSEGDYNTFKKEDFVNMILDAEAAFDCLKSLNANMDIFIIVWTLLFLCK